MDVIFSPQILVTCIYTHDSLRQNLTRWIYCEILLGNCRNELLRQLVAAIGCTLSRQWVIFSDPRDPWLMIHNLCLLAAYNIELCRTNMIKHALNNITYHSPQSYAIHTVSNPFPLPSRGPLPPNTASGSGGALKLPQRVQAEPGRQAVSSVF